MSEPELISMHVQRTAEVPFAAYKRQQAVLARRRLYPLSAFYTLYAILVLKALSGYKIGRAHV